MRLSTKSKWNKQIIQNIAIGLILLGMGSVSPALAATFSARISPPNFELKAKPGDVLRHVISIGNADTESAHYQIRTADWTLNEQGGVVIAPADQPLPSGSCRSWTRIERRSLRLAPGQTKRYRFEVHVPKDAVDGQCRFAIVVAPSLETVDTMAFGNFRFPITGSIAVIVYVTVGQAKPQLEFKGVYRQQKGDDTRGPVIRFTNTGNAHARPFGSIMARDASGRSVELIAVPFPILPDRTWDIELVADPETSGLQSMEELRYPLQLRGLIEWDGGTYRINDKLP